MVSELLQPYSLRIERREGLTPNMIQSLRSYPVIPDLIDRMVRLLVAMQAEQDLAQITMRRLRLYRLLLERDPDLMVETPYDRRPRYPFHVFDRAMTIARQVGILEGWGRIGLSGALREAVARFAPASCDARVAAAKPAN